MYVIKKVMGFMFQVIFLNPYCTFYGFLNSFHSKSCLSGITNDMYATTVFLYFLLQWIIRFVAMAMTTLSNPSRCFSAEEIHPWSCLDLRQICQISRKNCCCNVFCRSCFRYIRRCFRSCRTIVLRLFLLLTSGHTHANK